MTITNFTADEKQMLFEDLYCFIELTGGIHHQLKFLLVINSFMSIMAFLGISLILVFLHKESSLHSPSKLFDAMPFPYFHMAGWVQLALIVCYLPQGIVEIMLLIGGLIT